MSGIECPAVPPAPRTARSTLSIVCGYPLLRVPRAFVPCHAHTVTPSHAHGVLQHASRRAHPVVRRPRRPPVHVMPHHVHRSRWDLVCRRARDHVPASCTTHVVTKHMVMRAIWRDMECAPCACLLACRVQCAGWRASRWDEQIGRPRTVLGRGTVEGKGRMCAAVIAASVASWCVCCRVLNVSLCAARGASSRHHHSAFGYDLLRAARAIVPCRAHNVLPCVARTASRFTHPIARGRSPISPLRARTARCNPAVGPSLRTVARMPLSAPCSYQDIAELTVPRA